MAETAAPSSTPVVLHQGAAVSDPSPRVLESLYREVKQLEDKLLLRFDSIQVKFSSYDDAVRLLQDFANRQPTTEAVAGDVKSLDRFVNSSIAENMRLNCEKFKGVQDRFRELDLRYDQLDQSNKEAISAALRAAEKAVEKTEVNFTKSIDSLTVLINSNKGAIEATISDLKDRITIMEASKQGGQDSFKTMLSIVGAIVALATIGNIVVAFIR